jgi:hypothetical protein
MREIPAVVRIIDIGIFFVKQFAEKGESQKQAES